MPKLRIVAPARKGSSTSRSPLTESGTSPKKLRLLLADNHTDMLRQITELLAGEFEVVGAVTDGAALLATATELKPDVVVTDMVMPKVNGLEAGRKLLAQRLCKAVVVLTLYDDPELARSALQGGIRGYVLKDDAGQDLIPAIRSVIEGRTFLSPGISKKRFG